MNQPPNLRLGAASFEKVPTTHRLQWSRSYRATIRRPQYLEVEPPHAPRVNFYLLALAVAIMVATFLVPRLYRPIFSTIAESSLNQPAVASSNSLHEATNTTVETEAEPLVDLGSRVALSIGQVTILIALITFASGLALTYTQRRATYKLARSQFYQAAIEGREREVRRYETTARSYFASLVATYDIATVCEHARFFEPPPAEIRHAATRDGHRYRERRFVCTILTVPYDQHVHAELAWVDAVCADAAFDQIRLPYGWSYYSGQGSVAMDHAAYYSSNFLVLVEVADADYVMPDGCLNF